MSKLTREQVSEFLSYDPETGIFRWKKCRKNQTTPVGSVAGSNFGRYRQIKIGDRMYLASHLAWLLVHGRYPEGQLDHKNLNKKDDRIDNLRECTQSQNLANTRVHKNNKSTGIKGVYPDGKSKKYKAVIMHNRKSYRFGPFETAELAREVHAFAAELLHGEFARTG